jgi:hypothetical protein
MEIILMVIKKHGDTRRVYQTCFICMDSSLNKNLITASNGLEKTAGVHG